MKELDLQHLIDVYLEVDRHESYATILTRCCYHALNSDTPGLNILVDSANLLSQVLSLFDDIIDNDIDLGFWQNQFGSLLSLEQVRGSVVNLGTALFAIIGQKLSSLLNMDGIPPNVASRIQQATFTNIIPVVHGQQASIRCSYPTLSEAIKIAEYKSGHFYGLVCWNAAYLAKFDLEIANSLQKFGQIFGMIVQIANDMSDVWPHGEKPSDLKLGTWSLPVVYAMSVIPEDRKVYLKALLAAAPSNEEAEQEAREILIRSGAFVYWQIENQLRLNQAKELLYDTLADSPHREKLIGLMNYLLTVTAQ